MPTPRWACLTLVACAAAAAQGVSAQPAPPAKVDAAEQEPASWLPPLLWNGSLAYDLRTTRGSQGGSSLSQLVTANLGGKTYIYQPWLATLSGNLGITTNWSSQSAQGALDTGPSLEQRVRTREQFLTGNARLDVFPQSRFPFEAHVERNDTRTHSGQSSVLEYQTTRLGFSQHYRPATGSWEASGAYEHREQSGAGFRATQDTIDGTYGTRWRSNDLNLSASHSRARSIGIDDASSFNTLAARHNYAPSSSLSINSTANWTRTQELASAAASDLRVLQWSSVGVWRGEKSPLSITASARALQLREEISGTSLDTSGITLGGNYEVNRNLSLSGTTGLNITRSGDSQATAFNGALSGAYQGDDVEVAGVRYNWYASGLVGGSAGQGTATEGERQTTLNLQLGHTASRSWALGPQSSFSLNGGQTLSWNRTDSSAAITDPAIPGTETALLHNVAATWQTGGSGSGVYVRTSYSDALELQGAGNRFRLFNFQLSGTYEIDSRRSLSGDVTYQRTWQATKTASDAPAVPAGTAGASGEITYQEQRLFGLPRLRFVSRVKLAQDVLKEPGFMPSLPDRETRLWENRLDWSVGRLDTQLILRISKVDGKTYQSLMFRVQRMFGG